MVDVLTIMAGVLLTTTAGAALEYYRLLRKTQEEYEKARETVEDVILSFGRQLKIENKRLELVAYKMEGVTSRSEEAMNKAIEIEKYVHMLETSIAGVSEDKATVLARIEGITNSLRDVATSQGAVASKITALEEQARQLPVMPETNVAAVISIKRDKALAPLTETELSALEILASEGSRTAPEIKERVKLSREHTARLMKKLYESGYLERDTAKIPFRYSVKKEMEKLLKRTDPQLT
jgi:uncharacterized protein YoxC